MPKNILKIAVGLFCFSQVIMPACLLADAQNQEQVIYRQDQLIKDEETRDLLSTEKASSFEKQFFKFESGGWINTFYRHYKNLDNDVDTKDLVSQIWTYDLRLWGKFTLLNGNSAYLRLREDYNMKKNVSDYTGVAKGNSNDGPKIDVGYISLNFLQKKLQLRLGRQYTTIGRGIAYSDIHDGLILKGNFNHWALKTFFTHSLRNEDNVDYSVPGYDKRANNRTFFGLEAAYLGISQNAFYLYYLKQDDHSKPYYQPQDNTNQLYNYNSQYFGFGLSGRKRNLSYWGEVIKEIGKSYTDIERGDKILEKKSIDAWAAIAGVKYEAEFAMHPKTGLEFAWGSGNKNRINPTTTSSGNIYNKDTGFNYFGNYYGGYALSPRLSNLYIYKVEQSFEPLFFIKAFKDLAIGLKYYLYMKDKRGGGFSDTDATLDNSFAGTEFNAYLYWMISKNVYFSLRYGEFKPGKAFSPANQATTKYFYSRMTVNF